LLSRPVSLLAETVTVLAASSIGWGRAMLAALAGSAPEAAVYALAGAVRLSRSPWNFGGGRWVIRRHPPWRV
jgi:hypothetical protein